MKPNKTNKVRKQEEYIITWLQNTQNKIKEI